PPVNRTVTRTPADVSDERGPPPKLPLLRSMAAGPVLICVAVLITLNAFAFRGLLSSQHPDVLPFWLPTWCYLGKSLGAGHIRLWNPAVMGGIRFAARAGVHMASTVQLAGPVRPCVGAARHGRSQPWGGRGHGGACDVRHGGVDHRCSGRGYRCP